MREQLLLLLFVLSSLSIAFRLLLTNSRVLVVFSQPFQILGLVPVVPGRENIRPQFLTAASPKIVVEFSGTGEAVRRIRAAVSRCIGEWRYIVGLVAHILVCVTHFESSPDPRRPVRRGFRAAGEVCSVDLRRRPQSSSLGWCYIVGLVVYIVGLVVYILACISRLLRISDFRFTTVFDLPAALLWLHPRGFVCYIYSCLVTFWHQRVHCCTDEFTAVSRSCGRWYHYSALLFCRSYR
jgi:hypothetical protein